jgi:hypothetical protein
MRFFDEVVTVVREREYDMPEIWLNRDGRSNNGIRYCDCHHSDDGGAYGISHKEGCCKLAYKSISEGEWL